MDNGFNKKMLRYTILLGGLNFLISIFMDKEVIKPELYSGYVIVNISMFILSALMFLYNEKKDFNIKNSTLFCLMVALWGCYSQFLITGGYFTVIIVFFVVSLFSGNTVRNFSLFILLNSILCIWSINSSETFTGVSADLIDKNKMDAAYTVGMIGLFMTVSYFLKARILDKFKKLEAQMFDLGSKSSIFIHDLKNLVGPLVNDSKLVLRKTEINDIQRINQNLSNNISNLKEFILEFNQSFSFKEENGPIKIKDISDSIQRMYIKKMNNISFEISQKDELVGDPKTFKSILSNLIINSADAFVTNKVSDKKISISYANKKLVYVDTAGGMNPKKLKDISEDSYFTTKDNGSGIGIYTIKKYSALMKGKVTFENYQSGLKITIDFN